MRGDVGSPEGGGCGVFQGFPAWQWGEAGTLAGDDGLAGVQCAGDGGLRGGGPGWGDTRESGTHGRGPKLQAPGLQLRKLVWREKRCQPGTGPQELSCPPAGRACRGDPDRAREVVGGEVGHPPPGVCPCRGLTGTSALPSDHVPLSSPGMALLAACPQGGRGGTPPPSLALGMGAAGPHTPHSTCRGSG